MNDQDQPTTDSLRTGSAKLPPTLPSLPSLPTAMSAKTAHIVLVTLTVLVMVGCAQPAEEPPIETVEIGPGPTDNLRPDDDASEQLGAGNFAGQLPSDFPSALPAPPSSSVTSQSPGRVTFGTEDQVANVRAELDPVLARAGWTDMGGDVYTNGGYRVVIRYAESDGRTTITYVYRRSG